MSDEPFLSRWSRRKRAEARGEPVAPDAPAPVARTDHAPAPSAAADASGARTPVVPPDPPADRRVEPDAARAAPLPDPSTLTPDADFTPFMRAGVDAGTRNAALHRLFADPHFNVMDGLDIYIDDYSKPDPVTPALLATMRQAHTLGLFDAPEDDDAARHEAPGDAAGAGSDGAPAALADGTDAEPPHGMPGAAAPQPPDSGGPDGAPASVGPA